MADSSHSASALVARLCSPDRDEVASAKDALRLLGAEGLAALEEATRSDDARMRARARHALAELRRDRGLVFLARTLGEDKPDLLEGLLAIDEVLGVGERDSVEALVDGWTDAVRARLPEAPTPPAMAEALRQVLGESVGLLGPVEDFHHADHVSLTLTATTGRGLPLTLCALYAAVAKRAGVAAGLLPFPGHVLLGVGTPESLVIVDPFVGGALVSEEACVARLIALGAPPSPAWLLPATDRSMLLRHSRNLVAALERHGRRGLAQEVESLIAGLA